MNRDDIIKMAESCGIPEFENNESQADNIMRFAALVAAAEREKVAEEIFDMCKEGWWDSEGMRHHWSKRGQA